MRLRITAPGTGLLNGEQYPPVGAEIELPHGLAVSLVADQRAELIAGAEAAKRETRTVATPEKRGPGRPRKNA